MQITEISEKCRKKAAVLVRICAEKGLKITTAESCTGGLISSYITSVSGSSAVFDGALVSYANEVKAKMLGVSGETIKNDGVVSEACVKEMSAGAMKLFNADIAIAVSGIAGPTGAVPGKPVGTVYICVRYKEKCIVKRANFDGDRDKVRELTSLEALTTALAETNTKLW